MSANIPTVHLLCGYNGAGKTTYAHKLVTERRAIHSASLLVHTRISADDLLFASAPFLKGGKH